MRLQSRYQPELQPTEGLFFSWTSCFQGGLFFWLAGWWVESLSSSLREPLKSLLECSHSVVAGFPQMGTSRD